MIVRPRILLLATVSSVLLFSGCLGFWVRTPGEIEEIQTDQDAMAVELAQLSEAVAENESLLRGLQAQSGSRTADLVERLATLADELDLALARMGSAGTIVQQDTMVGPGAQLVFDESYRQFQQGSFGIAADGFGELVETYPASALADDAMYYMAISWEEMGQSLRAIEDLVALHYLYPGSEWAPGALFRAADIYGAHSAEGDRDRLIELLLELYPGSDEAALAREMYPAEQVGQE